MLAHAPKTAEPSERCRLLLVDDDDNFVDALRAVLAADARFDVVGRARDGVEAVRLAVELEPHVVSMDVNMPRMDGLTATRLITASRPAVRVIVCSGSTCDDPGAEARDAGAAGYVAKSEAATALADAALAVRGGERPFLERAV